MIKLFRRIAPRNNIYPKITPAPIGSPVLLDPNIRSPTFHKCGNIDIDTDLLLVGFASGLSYNSVLGFVFGIYILSFEGSTTGRLEVRYVCIVCFAYWGVMDKNIWHNASEFV